MYVPQHWYCSGPLAERPRIVMPPNTGAVYVIYYLQHALVPWWMVLRIRREVSCGIRRYWCHHERFASVDPRLIQHNPRTDKYYKAADRFHEALRYSILFWVVYLGLCITPGSHSSRSHATLFCLGIPAFSDAFKCRIFVSHRPSYSRSFIENWQDRDCFSKSQCRT